MSELGRERAPQVGDKMRAADGTSRRGQIGEVVEVLCTLQFPDGGLKMFVWNNEAGARELTFDAEIPPALSKPEAASHRDHRRTALDEALAEVDAAIHVYKGPDDSITAAQLKAGLHPGLAVFLALRDLGRVLAGLPAAAPRAGEFPAPDPNGTRAAAPRITVTSPFDRQPAGAPRSVPPGPGEVSQRSISPTGIFPMPNSWYWVWFEKEWQPAYWDGEDWEIHMHQYSVVTSRALPTGPKWEVPIKPANLSDATPPGRGTLA